MTIRDVELLQSWFSPVPEQHSRENGALYETLCAQERIEEMLALFASFPKRAMFIEWMSRRPDEVTAEQRVVIALFEEVFRFFRDAVGQALSHVVALLELSPGEPQLLELAGALKQLSSLPMHRIEKGYLEELLACSWFAMHCANERATRP